MGNLDSILHSLREIPPLREFPKTIDAACFNTVRIALLRLGSPLRIELNRPRLVMLIESKHWVAVPLWDESLPFLLWKDFDPVPRHNLHDSVHCTLVLLHHCAGLIMGTVLDALHHELRAQLTPTDR